MALEKIRKNLKVFGAFILLWGSVMLILDSINVSIVVKYGLASRHTRTASGIWGGFNYMVSGIVIFTTTFCNYGKLIGLCVNTIIAILEGIAVLVLQSLAAADCAPNAAGDFVNCNQSVYQLHIATAVFAGMNLVQEIIVTTIVLTSFSKIKNSINN